MKKLLLLFFSLLATGYIFQACDNTKTYAEMLDEEKDAVNAFIRKHNIKVISEEEFKSKGYTTDITRNEYVSFPSNGIYMQIVDKGEDKDTIRNNNVVAVRFVEADVKTNDTTCFNVVLPGFEEYSNYYTYPDVFRYVETGTTVAGVFLEGSMYAKYTTTDVPPGWLIALKYVTNYGHVKMIVPSKMGHQTASKYVNPYFYDIRKFQKALN